MATFETLAARFARCADLFRDPSAKEAQKTEFRAVIGLLQDAAVTLRVAAGRIEMNGVPCEGESLTRLIERLDLHGIAEIAIPQGPVPAELFELFRAIADQPGAADLAGRFGAAGADRIRVAPAPGAPPPRAAPVATPDDFGSRDPVLPSPGTPIDRASGKLGTGGILRGDSWTDITSVPIRGVPLVMHDPPPPSPRDALPSDAPVAPRPPERQPRPPGEISPAGLDAAAPPPPPAPPAPATPAGPTASPPPQRPPPRAGAPATGGPPRAAAQASLAAALPPGARDLVAELERHPDTPNTGDLLAGLVQHAEAALKLNRAEQLLAIVTSIMRGERRIPEAGGARRQYGIALHRISTKPALQALARLVGTPGYRADAVAALQRGGAAAVEVLIDLLIAAQTVDERRAVFDALRQMKEGTEQLVDVLDHSEWFVARNVAELIGEIGMEDGVPALTRQLGHKDERVRKAVGLALAKIGTRSAAEPVRRALRDKSVEVRMQVALGIGGRKSGALAMPLVVALEDEKDETVGRELILALGRIGSPDAVQALIKFAQPSGRLFGRKPSGLRLAAVEALRLAGTGPAVGTLEGLADDGDRDVRAAARAALTELKRKPRG